MAKDVPSIHDYAQTHFSGELSEWQTALREDAVRSWIFETLGTKLTQGIDITPRTSIHAPKAKLRQHLSGLFYNYNAPFSAPEVTDYLNTVEKNILETTRKEIANKVDTQLKK